MRIRHTDKRGKRSPQKPPTGGGGAVSLFAAVLLFLAAFGGKHLLPQASEPVFRAMSEVLSADMDLTSLAREAAALLQDERDGAEVFLQVLGLNEQRVRLDMGEYPHLSWELNWLSQETDVREWFDHYLPRWREQEKPGWLP